MQRSKNDSRVIKQLSLDSFSNPHRIFSPNYSFNWILNWNKKPPKNKNPQLWQRMLKLHVDISPARVA